MSWSSSQDKHRPALLIEEEDASPTGRPRTLKVSDGSLTDNGDGSFSLASLIASSATATFSNVYVDGTIGIEGIATGSVASFNIFSIGGDYQLPGGDPPDGFVMKSDSGILRWEVGGGAVEGTAVLSTGEGGATKYLREDGDGTSSWQVPAGGGDLLANATVPMTSDWDIGNFDITLKALTGDGTIEGATLTEGGNAVYSLTEAPTHTVAGNALDIQNTTDATPNQVAIFKSGNRAVPADGDAGYFCFFNDDDTGTQVEFARMTWFALDVTNNTKDAAFRFDVMRDDSLIEMLYLSTNSIVLNDDGNDVNFNLEGANDVNLLWGDAGLDTITIGSNTSLGKFGIDGDQDEIQLLVQGNATQVTSLIVAENSAGVDQMTLSNTGILNVTGASASVGVISTAYIDGTLGVNGIATMSVATIGVMTLGKGYVDGNLGIESIATMSVASIGVASISSIVINEQYVVPFFQDIDYCIFEPDNVNDEISIFYVNPIIYPNGIYVQSLSITLAADAGYSMVYEEWSGDPPVAQADIATVTTGAGDAFMQVGGAAITNPYLEAGDYVFLDIPATDVDWVSGKMVYYIWDND